MKLKKNQPRLKILGLILVLIGVFVVSLVWMRLRYTEQLNARPFYQRFEEAVGLMKSTDLRVGSGEEAKRGARVTLHYVGKLKDGSVFDSSRARNQPVVFELGAAKALPCFDRGVIGMKTGGIRRLEVPSLIAYGAVGVPGVVPPGADVEFEMELIALKPVLK